MKVHELYRRARQVSLWGVAASLGLGVLKLVGGILGNSLALVSDAIHSLGDALTSAAVWGALLWAERPADVEHPYGHMRAEAVAGSSVALLLILSGVAIGWEAVYTLAETSPPPAAYTLAIAIGSLIVKEGLFRYGRRVATQTGSTAVRAAAWDHRLDALASLAVLAGLVLARWADLHAADHIAALIVAIIVFVAGCMLYWRSLHELMDRQADVDILQHVRKEALGVPGVLGVEKLLARKAGLEYLVDIHVEVDPNISVRDGHATAHAVKNRLLEGIVGIKDVLVHIEPSPTDALVPRPEK